MSWQEKGMVVDWPVMQRWTLALLRHLPRNALSRAVGSLVRARWPGPVHRAGIRTFVRLYGIDLDEAAGTVIDYPTFGAFFTRTLVEGARPIEGDEGTLVSPCDGTIGAFGQIEDGTLIQAKGRSYALDAFLGGEQRARDFRDGAFLTIYLSPRHYHRVHAPASGAVVEAVHVPGTLWPVFPHAVDTVDGLFVANERLLTFMEGAHGAFCVAMVGATCVGRMRASYDTIVTNVPGPAVVRRYTNPPRLARGDELGVFEMGSTVVLLLSPGMATLAEALGPGQEIRMGQAIGRLVA